MSSAGREIKDFLSAFTSSYEFADRVEARGEARRAAAAKDPNNFPGMAQLNAQYPGMAGQPVKKQGWLARQFASGAPNMGSAVPLSSAAPAYEPSYEPGYEDPVYAESYAEGGAVPDGYVYQILYDENGQPVGEIPEAPSRLGYDYEQSRRAAAPLRAVPVSYDTNEGAPMEQAPGVRTAVIDYPGREVANRMPLSVENQTPGGPAGPNPTAGTLPPVVVPAGGTARPPSGARKALSDQTRTEAYDPTLDGPGTAPVASQGTTTPTGKPTPLQNAPLNDRTQPDGLQRGGIDQESMLSQALVGGMTYADNIFHLKGDGAALPGTDPMQAKGRRAFMSGVGAADSKDVQAMDRVLGHAPGGGPGSSGVSREAEYGMRRLELIYKHYALTGETDKANKAAFELMQWGATMAAKHGTEAKTLYQRGDTQGAVKQLVEGYNYLPDGKSASAEGNVAVFKDVKTGEVVQQIPFTPKMVFDAALGLSNKSLYWNTIMQRAVMTNPALQKDTAGERRAEVDAARIRLMNARTAKLQSGGGGRGRAAAPTGSPALQKLLEVMGSSSPASAPPGAGVIPQGDAASQEQQQQSDPTDPLTDESGEEIPQGDGGPNPTGAKPQSVVRLKPEQKAATPTTTPAGNIPAPAPGTPPPGYKNREPTPDDVPDRIAHNNRYVDEQATKPVPYQVARPKPWQPPEGFAALRGKLTAKEDVILRSELKRKDNEYKAADAKWEKDRVAFERQQRDAHKQTLDQYRIETKELYNKSYDPATITTMQGALEEGALKAVKERIAKEKPAMVGKTIFDDGTVKSSDLTLVATSLTATNPNLTPEAALEYVFKLTRHDPQDPKARGYKPLSKDVHGNVMLQLEDGQIVHVKPNAFELTKMIVKGRQALEKEAKAKAEVKAETTKSQGGTIAEQAAGLVSKDTAKYVFQPLPYGLAGERNLAYDALKAPVALGMQAGDKVNQMLRAIPKKDIEKALPKQALPLSFSGF